MAKYETEQRKKLHDFFAGHPHEFFSAKEIFDSLEGEDISKSAVYRNLSEMEQDKLLRRYSKPGSRETFYQYTGKKSCQDHIHLSCKSCGRVIHLDTVDTANLVENAASHKGFMIDKQETVLYGICDSCQRRGK